MKILTLLQKNNSIPGLFSVALEIENQKFETPEIMKPASASKNSNAAATGAANKKTSKPWATRAAYPQRDDSETSVAKPVDDLQPAEFFLEAPLAESVKLAANFTEWEKCPLDMIKSENGIWVIIVPLPPGDHPYRFIVDGEWHDDPQAAQYVANPFGTENAVRVVS